VWDLRVIGAGDAGRLLAGFSRSMACYFCWGLELLGLRGACFVTGVVLAAIFFSGMDSYCRLICVGLIGFVSAF
jgi:hypothetical protein